MATGGFRFALNPALWGWGLNVVSTLRAVRVCLVTMGGTEHPCVACTSPWFPQAVGEWSSCVAPGGVKFVHRGRARRALRLIVGAAVL